MGRVSLCLPTHVQPHLSHAYTHVRAPVCAMRPRSYPGTGNPDSIRIESEADEEPAEPHSLGFGNIAPGSLHSPGRCIRLPKPSPGGSGDSPCSLRSRGLYRPSLRSGFVYYTEQGTVEKMVCFIENRNSPINDRITFPGGSS